MSTLLRRYFSKGQFQKIADHYDMAPARTAVSAAHYIGASLYFLGRLVEAESVLKRFRARLSPQQVAVAQFYRLLAMTRVSRYEEAQLSLEALERISRRTSSHEIRFFYFQGHGFYHYYRGDYARAESSAAQALDEAPRLKNALCLALAKDLWGQTLIQMGRIHKGLHSVAEAAALLLRIEHESLHTAIRAAHLAYRAQFGLAPETILNELETTLNSARFQDSYSQANLGLELARQLTLRGAYQRATTELERIAPLIYQHENRRQEILLNLRLAEVSFHLHEFFQAHHFARAARRCLSYEVDSIFELRVLGFELKLAEAQARDIPALRERFTALTAQLDFVWNNRIQQRSQKLRPAHARHVETHPQEDRLGELLDKISTQNTESAIETVLTTPYLGILHKILHGFRPGTVLLDARQGSLLILAREGWSFVERLSPLQLKLLHALRQPQSKEHLIATVWGYKYESHRHDSVLYAAIAALRKVLGPLESALVTTENGYELRAPVQTWQNEASPSPKSASDLTPAEDLSSQFALNYRQRQILKYLKRVEFLTASRCRDLFKTSLVTATRDLSQLHRHGLAQRVGRGRATVYVQIPHLAKP